MFRSPRLLLLAALALPISAQNWEKTIATTGAGSAIGAGSGPTIYAAARSGDVYRSDDNGRTWAAVNSGLTDSFGKNMLATAFAIGANGRVIRGGVNASWNNRIGSPIFYSDNGGAQWIETPLPFGSPAPNPAGIAVSDMVSHQGAVYFSEGLSAGVWKSTDNGLTWTSAGDSLPVVSPFGPPTKTYYALASAGNALLTVEALRGVHRSTDGGASWAQSVSGIPGVINSPLVGGRSWSGTDVDGLPDGTAAAVVDRLLYLSRDAGATWQGAGPGLFGARKVALTDGKIYVATDGPNPEFFESADFGVSWQRLPAPLSGATSLDILSQSFEAHNGALYFAGADGIYRLDLAAAERMNLAPLVTVSPANLLVNLGGTLRLGASVQGSAPYTVEWRVNGAAVAGQASQNLPEIAFAWAIADTNQSGEVSLVVRNAAGAVTNVLGNLVVAPVGPGLPDYSFRPQLIAGGFVAAAIHAFAVDNDGSVFFGGENLFSISGETFRGLRHAFADGGIDAKFVTGVLGGNGTGPGVGTPVRTLLPLGDGSVLVGAAGTGNNERFWRRMLADGALDPEWPWPESMAGGPRKAVRLADGKFLVASGSAAGLHRLNGDGTLDDSFTLLGEIGRFQRNFVSDFAVLPDGRIIITGNFNTIDNVPRRGIARLVASGGLDASFAPADIGSNREVSALLPLEDGKILIGGNFTTVGGQPRASLARLNADGTLDATFPNLALNGPVFTLARQPDGKIWAGGSFTGFSGRSYLVRLNGDGTLDASMPDLQLDGAVQKVEVGADGKLWIGSAATRVAGYPAGQLVRIFTGLPAPALGYAGLNQTPLAGSPVVLQGTVTGPYNSLQWRFNGQPIAGANRLELPLGNVAVSQSGLYDFTVQSAGGSYTAAPVNVRVRGAVVLDLQPQPAVGFVSNRVTFAAAAFGQLPVTYQWLRDGAVIPGAVARTLTLTNLILASAGDYSVRVTGGDGSALNSEAAFLTVIPVPGTRDTTFAPKLFEVAFNAPATIGDFILLPGGQVLAMGQFAFVAKGAVQRFARLNSDGSVDTSFQGDATPYTEVLKAAVQSTGQVLLLVRMNQGGGEYQVRRLLPNGELDGTFTPWPVPGFPSTLAVGPDDAVYVAHGGVSRLGSNGALDAAFAAKAVIGGGVSSLSLDDQGRIYVAGNFTQVSGQNFRTLARLLPDGSLDTSFAPAGSLPFPVRVQSVRGGVLFQHFDGIWRFTESGERDLAWQFTGKLAQFDLLADGSVAGIVNANSGQGAIIDAQGRAGRPVASFAFPGHSQGYTQFRAAADGSFYLSPGPFGDPNNILMHISGTVVPLAFAGEPVGMTVNQGGTVTLRSGATGTSAVSYQWQKNGADIPGETGANLVVTNAPMSATGEYRVVVRNRSGTAVSRVAPVVVLGTPEILSLSNSLTVGVADRFVLEARARGVAPLAYQWRHAGAAIPGATSAFYTNFSAALADSGAYDLVVSNPLGSTASAALNVSVVVIPGALIGGFAPPLASADELALLPDGRILIGNKHGGAGAYDPQGNPDPGFAVFGGNNTDWREKIAVDAARGRVYISPSSTLRALDFTGQPIPNFASAPINVRMVRVEAGGSILVSDNGISPTIKRLDTNGAVVAGFAPTVSRVIDYRPLADGRILVLTSAQRISGFNFVFDTALMRLNADGSNDASFIQSTNIYVLGEESAGLATDRQGRILVWGAFKTYLQQPRSRLARLNADGTLDSSFTPAEIDGGISDVAGQDDGKLAIAGSFTKVGDRSRNRIARLNADGSHDASFDPGSGLTNAGPGQVIAFDVEILPDGQILVAGVFEFVNGVRRPGAALLTGGEPSGQGNPFQDWAAAAGLTGASAAPAADPDGDGIPNQAEFAYGTSPADAGSRPLFKVAPALVGNQPYPSVTFTRRVGSPIRAEASRSVSFGTLLPVIEATVPSAAGFEQVTIRTSEPQTGPGAQFFRLLAE